jgi:hypothetical protein
MVNKKLSEIAPELRPVFGRMGGLARNEATTHEQRVEMGKKGGKARAEKLSPERRKEIARQGAVARWGEKKK